MTDTTTPFLCLYQDITHATKITIETVEARSARHALEQYIAQRQAAGWSYQAILVQSAPQIIDPTTATIYQVDNYGEVQPSHHASYRGMDRFPE